MRMPEDNEGLAPTDSRYRALLDVSSAMVEQPTVKAVLHSLRQVLFSSCRLHGVHLYVLGGEGESLHLLDFDRVALAVTLILNEMIWKTWPIARCRGLVNTYGCLRS